MPNESIYGRGRRYRDPTPLRALLIGGPVHNRRTELSRQQVEDGYEFVDSGYHGLKSTNEGPHSHWRSGHYKYLTTIDDVNIMVHASVTEPSAWTFAEKLENARDDLTDATDKVEALNREIKEADSERVLLNERLRRIKKFNKMARELLEEVEND